MKNIAVLDSGNASVTLPRVYPILDTETLHIRKCHDWAMVSAAMLSGGAEILQFRHKADWSREVFTHAEEIAGQCRRAGAFFVVNDRADMARLLGAGVHAGQEDLTPTACRKVIGKQAMLGYSTHNADQVSGAAGEPIDYLAFGPVFATASKQNPDPVAGLEMLAHARLQTKKPLVAIGGITRATALEVFRAGADSVAVIADLLPETLNEFTIRNRMEEWQRLTRQ